MHNQTMLWVYPTKSAGEIAIASGQCHAEDTALFIDRLLAEYPGYTIRVCEIESVADTGRCYNKEIRSYWAN